MKAQTFVALIAILLGAALDVPAESLAEGTSFKCEGKTARVKKLPTDVAGPTEYGRLFRFDSWANPKLKELRSQYKLDDVVASGSSEFEKQVLLMDWVHQQFKKFGQPSTQARGALEILQGIREGETFFCSQYAQVLVSCAASLGWVNRPLALRRHQGSQRLEAPPNIPPRRFGPTSIESGLCLIPRATFI